MFGDLVMSSRDSCRAWRLRGEDPHRRPSENREYVAEMSAGPGLRPQVAAPV